MYLEKHNKAKLCLDCQVYIVISGKKFTISHFPDHQISLRKTVRKNPKLPPEQEQGRNLPIRKLVPMTDV